MEFASEVIAQQYDYQQARDDMQKLWQGLGATFETMDLSETADGKYKKLTDTRGIQL